MIIPSIHSLYRPESSPKMDLEVILHTVCRYFNVKPIDLMTRYRGRDIIPARHISMYLMLKYHKITLKKVGEYFGRDHSTVIAAKRRIEGLIQVDIDVREQVKQIENLLYETGPSIKNSNSNL